MATLDQLALDLHEAVLEAEDLAVAAIVPPLTKVITRAWSAAVNPQAFTAAATDLPALQVIAQWKLPDDLTAILSDVYRQGAVTAVAGYQVSGGTPPIGEDLGGPVFDPEVARYMAEATNRLVRIPDAAWQLARDALTRSLEDGTPREAMKRVLQDLIRVTEERADRIVRTETNMAANAGVSSMGRLMADAGLAVRKRWFTMGDHRVRPSHEDAEGQEVPLEDPFIVGGFSLMFPGDPHGPPQEVIQCRCTHLIVEGKPEEAPPPPSEAPRPGMGDIPVPVEDFDGDNYEGSQPLPSSRTYYDPDTGRFTPERQALHDQIVAGYLDSHAAQEHPQFLMLGGGPASGKTTQLLPIMRDIPDATTVDADAIKLLLLKAQYGEDQAAWPSDWPQWSHEESSYLVRRVTAGALERRSNIIVDGTGDGSPGALAKKLEAARSAGFEVRGEYATIDPDEAWARAQSRGARTGRVLLETQVKGGHRKVSQALAPNMDLFDEVNVYDTTVKGKPLLLATGRRGQGTTIHDPAGWDRFLAKGETDPLDYYRKAVRDALVDDSLVRDPATRQMTQLGKDTERRIRQIGAEVDAKVTAKLPQVKGVKVAEAKAAAEQLLVESTRAWERDATQFARQEGFATWEDHWEATGLSLDQYRDRVDLATGFGTGFKRKPNAWRRVRDKWLLADRDATRAEAQGVTRDSYTAALREVLTEQGIPMGPPGGKFSTTLVDAQDTTRSGYIVRRSKKIPQAKVYEANSVTALANYPTAWSQRSEDLFATHPDGGMLIGPARGGDRGWQYSTPDAKFARINIPTSRQADLGLYVHEWGHRMEASNRQITRAEWLFRTIRAEGKPVKWLGQGYARSEVAVDDKFTTAYAGKVYGDAPSAYGELLTMGMEGLYRGPSETAGVMMRDEEDYRQFIMGLLALL